METLASNYLPLFDFTDVMLADEYTFEAK